MNRDGIRVNVGKDGSGMTTPETWTLPDGTPLLYQDGDHVEIDLSGNPEAAFRLPFISGYVRGYDISTDGEKTSVAYELFNVGNNPLHGVREDRLKRTSGRFGIGHGRGAHGGGESCPLCGANL